MAWTAKPLVCQGIGAAATLAPPKTTRSAGDCPLLRGISDTAPGFVGKSTMPRIALVMVINLLI
jgi:hypothetical protein